MELEFSGPVWFWRGPAPWHFVSVPPELCGYIVPIKTDVRRAEHVEVDDEVALRLLV